MDLDKMKKFTNQAKSSIKGEAFFELLLAEFAIPHRIVGSKDIGIDYFCEWVFDNRPTGILFAVQVKTFQQRNVTVSRDVECEKRQGNLNRLEPYIIKNSLLDFKNNQPATLQYWKGLGIPVYVFVFVIENNSKEISCYYRRYAPLLTSLTGHDDSGEYFEGFIKRMMVHPFMLLRTLKIANMDLLEIYSLIMLDVLMLTAQLFLLNLRVWDLTSFEKLMLLLA